MVLRSDTGVGDNQRPGGDIQGITTLLEWEWEAGLQEQGAICAAVPQQEHVFLQTERDSCGWPGWTRRVVGDGAEKVGKAQAWRAWEATRKTFTLKSKQEAMKSFIPGEWNGATGILKKSLASVCRTDQTKIREDVGRPIRRLFTDKKKNNGGSYWGVMEQMRRIWVSSNWNLSQNF